jgi:hypothetical protein
VEKGKEAFVKYVKTFPDSVIFQFWYYLFGTGLSVRAEHMPKDYLKNEK